MEYPYFSINSANCSNRSRGILFLLFVIPESEDFCLCSNLSLSHWSLFSVVARFKCSCRLDMSLALSAYKELVGVLIIAPHVALSDNVRNTAFITFICKSNRNSATFFIVIQSNNENGF